MSERKKKPVQYFFVDVNDPDYYKRIKVARACIDCRKRKPGSGPCSSCRKHNKICEFTTTTFIPSSVPITSSSSSSTTASSSSSSSSAAAAAAAVARTTTTIQWIEETQDHSDRRKGHQQQQRRRSHLVSRHHRLALSTKITPRSSNQADIECNWTPHQLTLLPFTVPADSNETTDNNNRHHNNNNTSQSVVTPEEHHLVGHLRLDLPVRCVQMEYNQAIPLLPTPPPPLLSSHSISAPSSTTTTPSPPLYINHANGATFQNSTSDSAHSNLEISMHSVSLHDKVKTDHCLSIPCAFDLELLDLYFEQIHPTFPVLSKHLLKLREHLPLCLDYAIKAVALLYHPQIDLAHDYHTRAWKSMQSRGTNDLVSAQTLLVLYKYHETIGKVKPALLESAQTTLDQLGSEGSRQEEWLCRLKWIVYLHQVNGEVAWRDPPLVRLPCLLPCEQHDPDQVKIMAQLLDNIQMTCVYTSAMQSLDMAAVDPWAAQGQHLDETD